MHQARLYSKAEIATTKVRSDKETIDFRSQTSKDEWQPGTSTTEREDQTMFKYSHLAAFIFIATTAAAHADTEPVVYPPASSKPCKAS